MDKWEYKTIEGIPHSYLLNQIMGIEGWEMCGVCSPSDMMKPIYYFKRKIKLR